MNSLTDCDETRHSVLSLYEHCHVQDTLYLRSNWTFTFRFWYF